MRIFIVGDELTTKGLMYTPHTLHQSIHVSKLWKSLRYRPDLILVESAWRGYKDSWRYKIANYPDYPKRNNNQLLRLLEVADKYKIPAIFWNKEDSAHFHRFIGSASLFDYILTVDINCVSQYESILGKGVKVGVLPFALQPKFHHPVTFLPLYKRSLFVGSYSTHIHDLRRKWQDMAFSAAAPYGLTIVDRNSDRKSDVYRYPYLENTRVLPSVSYDKTGDLYHKYSHCLNVNTVTNSASMFSRRLIEIMACGRLAVTNPSLSVTERFEGMCEVVTEPENAAELFEQLSKGYTKHQIEMMKYASNHVLKNYTYDKWLKTIFQFVGFDDK